jgi:hypothetical protein
LDLEDDAEGEEDQAYGREGEREGELKAFYIVFCLSKARRV